MRCFLVCVLLSLGSAAKDNFILSFLLLRVQGAERFERVDAENFQGQRTGFGLLIETEKVRDWSLEAGLLKANRQYSIVRSGSVVVEEIERLHLPLAIRWSPLRSLSLGLGAYGAYPVSDRERATESDLPTGESPGEETSSHEDEYGSLASIAGQVPLLTTGALLFLDVRWLEPFNSKRGEDTNNLFTMAGIRIEI